MMRNTKDKTQSGEFALNESDAELFFYAGKDYQLRPDIYPDFKKQWNQYLKAKNRAVVSKSNLIECVAEAALAFFPSSDIKSSIEFAVYVFDKLTNERLISDTRMKCYIHTTTNNTEGD